MEIKIDRRPPTERLRTIPFDTIVERVAACCFEAACRLPLEVMDKIRAASLAESSELGRSFLDQYLENARIAAGTPMPPNKPATCIGVRMFTVLSAAVPYFNDSSDSSSNHC